MARPVMLCAGDLVRTAEGTQQRVGTAAGAAAGAARELYARLFDGGC